jgi:glycerophosphoryl diester phosphodiesterase
MFTRPAFYQLIVSSFVCLSVWANYSFAEEPQPAPANNFLQNGVTAHRGNSSEFPENSLAALESGIAVGADWIELDIFRSSDGKLVVIHDRQTGRVGDRDLNVTQTPYSELAQVDVAFQFRQSRGLTLESCPKETMPLLEDVLKAVMRQTKTRVSIQPKMACVPEAIELIRSLKCESWCGFNDGNLELMTQVKQLAPNIRVFWDRPPGANLDADIETARKLGFESLVLHQTLIHSDTVAKIKAAGMEVGAWTVNDLAMLHRFKQLGVDRIYTDRPRELLALQNYNRLDGLTCEGKYPKHLQGVCLGEDNTIFWSFTTQLVKTDFDGKVLKQIPVADHHGDLCLADGKIYVAVNLGKFNDPNGNAENWIIAYDPESLEEWKRYPVPEVTHGAGGIAYHAGKFIVVGGLAPGINENYLYEYDSNFAFQKRHSLSTGYTLMGIQTATFAHDRWWFGCYGDPKTLITTNADFADLKHVTFEASLGIVGIDSGRLVIATGNCQTNSGCEGKLRVVLADELLKTSPVQAAKQ